MRALALTIAGAWDALAAIVSIVVAGVIVAAAIVEGWPRNRRK